MSEQFIKKNIRTPIYEYKETTWVYNNIPTFENDTYALFDDKFPVTPGHVLFVPKNNNTECVAETYGKAYQYGLDLVEQGKAEGFNIGQNIGMPAGQTILWPHIHVIPRHKGDYDGGTNGIRLSFPKGDHKDYY